MTLRSVNPYTSYQVLLDLQRTKDQMANLSEQIASGNRLNRLGDDPTASALVLNFQDSIQKNKAYIKQADSATSFLQTTETSLRPSAIPSCGSWNLGHRGWAPPAPAGRTAIAPEVNGIRDNAAGPRQYAVPGEIHLRGDQDHHEALQPRPATGGHIYAGDIEQTSTWMSRPAPASATNIPGDTAFFDGAPEARTGTSSPR